jgi:hypothetical protein
MRICGKTDGVFVAIFFLLTGQKIQVLLGRTGSIRDNSDFLPEPDGGYISDRTIQIITGPEEYLPGIFQNDW